MITEFKLMSNPIDAIVHEIHGTLCTYYQREDGIHLIRFYATDHEAVPEMAAHFRYIGENFAHEGVNRIFLDSSIYRSPNLSAIFREMRAMDRKVSHRAKGRVALIRTDTFFNTLLNAMVSSISRSGDKFRIFGSTEIDRAEAWLKHDQ